MSLLKVNKIRNRTGSGAPELDYGVNVTSGISTLSGVKIQTGIVTSVSQSGIVTFYGDGKGLTNIPNSGLQNSTISGKGLGTNLSNLTAGSYLTSGGTYNGSTARTFAVDATSSNTGDKVVVRDTNGDFSSRYITASQFIRSGGSSTQFLKADGSVDSNTYITSASIGDGTLTFAASNGVSLSASPSFTANQSANKTITVSTNATAANNGTTIVLRGSNGEFSAGQITATSIVSTGNVTGTGFVVTGQTGFLKADGTIDTNTYLSSTTGVGNGQLTLAVNGSGLSISATPTFTANQSTNKSITLSVSSSSINTPSSLVFRDVSGNFTSNTINLDGDLVAVGNVSGTNVTSTSDINLKKDVKKIENALEIISGIDGVSFKWKSNNQTSFGVIAQELEKIIPEVVCEINDKKTVNYNALVGFLIESIKELKSEIEELKKK